MADAKVTSKGQITIPKAVRERLNLESGDRVWFEVQDDHTVILKARKLPFKRLFGMLHDPKAKRLSIASMEPGRTRPYNPDVEE